MKNALFALLNPGSLKRSCERLKRTSAAIRNISSTMLNSMGIVGLLLIQVAPSNAHLGDRVFPIYELTDADLARIDLEDGSTEDWLEVVGEPSLTILDFAFWNGSVSLDPSDLDFRIWLGWHDATDRIYVAMERVDDVYTNDFMSKDFFMWSYDSSFQISVDGDHSGGEYHAYGMDISTEAEFYQQLLLDMQQAQDYVAIAEVFDDSSPITIPVPGQLEDWFRYPPFAHAGGGKFSENPIISVTEVYLTPFDRFVWNSSEESRISELHAGKIIGFNMSVVDSDAGPDNPHLFFRLPVLIDRDNAKLEASAFADELLLGAGEEMPENTTVENITWARIKASFAR